MFLLFFRGRFLEVGTRTIEQGNLQGCLVHGLYFVGFDSTICGSSGNGR
jgi:hypothetical protein